MAVYSSRRDAKAVVHAHPPAATARACAGLGLEEPFLPEAVVSLGPRVPLVPFALPGPGALSALAPYLEEFDAVILQSHGVLTWGDDPQMALLRMELVEHLARIARDAAPYGGVRPLSPTVLAPLLDARSRAGLGPEGRRRKQPRFIPEPEKSPPDTPMGVMRRLVSR